MTEDDDDDPLAFTVNEREGLIEFDPADHWIVSVNRGQRHYIVEAPTAAFACQRGGDEWRADLSLSDDERKPGIYDIAATRTGSESFRKRAAPRVFRRDYEGVEDDDDPDA